jgi:CRP-like cAMP-binding protein
MSVFAGQELEEFIKSKKTIREYQKGDVICSQGEESTLVYLLVSGYVKIYDIDEEGNERSISVFKQGSIFPITWLLSDMPKQYLYYYEALARTTCYVAEASAIYEFVRKRPTILISLVDHLVRSYINLAGRIQNLEKSRVGERLEFLLFHLAVTLGYPDGEITRIDASITQEDIARLAGVTRESLSLEINQRDDRPYWRNSNSTYIDLGNIDSSYMPTVLNDEEAVQET